MTLNAIGLKHGTDKSSNGHDYLKHYEEYVKSWRETPITMIEVGVGGYQRPDRGGQSLRMWAEYFTHPQTKIIGVDVYEKRGMETDRIKIYKGSQNDGAFWGTVVEEMGAPDLIVDDASHLCSLTVETFEILFWLLKPGGIYIVEDIHTSYWGKNSSSDYGGNEIPGEPGTTVAFLKGLVDMLQQDSIQEEYRSRYAGYLAYIHFFRNTCIIKKMPL